jgi:hypothetical protein
MRIQTLILFACLAVTAQAQSNRSPNTVELAAIKKAQHVVEPFINSFENDNWEKKDGGSVEEEYLSVQDNPDVVMGIAPFNDWHFIVKENSPYFNASIKPLQDKIISLTSAGYSESNVQQEVALGKQLKKLRDIYVEVFVNLKNLPEKIQKGSKSDLNIAGAAYAYKETENKTIGTQRESISSYVLAFGDWSTAVLNKNYGAYDFKFLHKNGTPYIENIVIRVSGNDERIHELLQLDWNKINEALTR